MTTISERPRKLRILDFDIENRPLTYRGNDLTSAEITGIAWSFLGSKRIDRAALTFGQIVPEILERFLEDYARADVVTGHYIRGHDLKHINAALMEYEHPPLAPKLASDTYLDLTRRHEMSHSQENLAADLGVTATKYHMTQAQWREANRLTPDGVQQTLNRVVSDVVQHKELRERLVGLGWLGPPKLWKP